MRWRCRRDARNLPRALAASILISVMLIWFRPVAGDAVPRSFRIALVVAGAWVALRVARAGAELAREYAVESGSLTLAAGSGDPIRLPLGRVDRLRWEPPMGPDRRLVPATVLIDRDGREWRLPALIEGGALLVRRVVAETGREDLEAWADALGVERKMARERTLTAVGYAFVVALPIATTVLFLMAGR